jgi:hypothetical protein
MSVCGSIPGGHRDGGRFIDNHRDHRIVTGGSALSVTVRRTDASTVSVVIEGEFDLTTVPVFADLLDAALAMDFRTVRIDMSGVAYQRTGTPSDT